MVFQELCEPCISIRLYIAINDELTGRKTIFNPTLFVVLHSLSVFIYLSPISLFSYPSLIFSLSLYPSPHMYLTSSFFASKAVRIKIIIIIISLLFSLLSSFFTHTLNLAAFKFSHFIQIFITN